MRFTGRLLFAVGIVASAAGCGTASRTEMFRKDVLSDAQQAIADTKINSGDMTIDGSVDRPDTTYNPGEPITLTVRTSKNANVAILRVLADGDSTIVFPNRLHPSAAVSANTPMTVPGPGDVVKITADKPGIVLFEFIASTSGESWLFKRAPDKAADFADLGVTSRNIAKDIVTNLKIGPGHNTAATYLTVRVTGRGML